MDVSLNDGYELENEQVFEEPIIAGELPELDADIKIVVAFEEQVLDLSRVAEDIERAGGMCQRFALEAEAIVPGYLITDRVPLGYYSKDISATRLKVALEEVSKGMWALIAAGIAAALALLWKLISWFRGRGGEDADGNAGSGGDIAAKHESSSETIDQVKRIMEDVQHDKTSDGDTLDTVARDMAIRRDTKIYDFLRNQNELVSDLLNHGALARELEKVCRGIDKANGMFKNKVMLLNQTISNDTGSDDITTDNRTSMNTRQIMIPIAVVWSEKLKGNIVEVAKELDDHFTIKAAQPHKLGDNWDRALTELSRAMDNQGLVKTLKDRSELDDNMDALHTSLAAKEKLYSGEHDDKIGGLSLERGKEIRQCMAFMMQEVTALVRVYKIIMGASTMMQKLVTEAVLVQEDLVREMESRCKSAGTELPESVKKLKDKLKELKKKK